MPSLMRRPLWRTTRRPLAPVIEDEQRPTYRSWAMTSRERGAAAPFSPSIPAGSPSRVEARRDGELGWLWYGGVQGPGRPVGLTRRAETLVTDSCRRCSAGGWPGTAHC